MFDKKDKTAAARAEETGGKQTNSTKLEKMQKCKEIKKYRKIKICKKNAELCFQRQAKLLFKILML